MKGVQVRDENTFVSRVSFISWLSERVIYSSIFGRLFLVFFFFASVHGQSNGFSSKISHCFRPFWSVEYPIKNNMILSKIFSFHIIHLQLNRVELESKTSYY